MAVFKGDISDMVCLIKLTDTLLDEYYIVVSIVLEMKPLTIQVLHTSHVSHLVAACQLLPIEPQLLH